MFNAPTMADNDSIFSEARAKSPWSLARSTEIKLMIAIVIAQIAILIGMIVLDGLPLVLGEHVKLKVVPVDPRDLFRGDYVVLDYEFSRVDPGSVTGLAAGTTNGRNPYDYELQGQEVFVSLVPSGDHHEAASRSTKRPNSGPYIRGTLTSPWRQRLDCGIEAYYVQEGEGRRLETLIRDRKILAEVAVWHGHAKLVRLVE